MAHDETDILIVGAGLAGAATAYHLAQSAPGRVAIVEQESTAGVHSSGRNAAIVREHVAQPALQPLLTEGAEVLRSGRLARFER
ncbi:MAG: FAD-dependent oxidoreductase, partial [Planctomycetota bacterium]|nr:FAD-dependent oxidoreductase [Planctomycetota bacterium]